MKTHPIKPQSKTRSGLRSLALGLALLGSAGAARADDLLVGAFDTDISALGYQQWRGYGYVTSGSVAWDGSQDADGNVGSGSLYITADWPQTGWNTGWNDIQFFFNAPTPFTIEDYLTVEASVKIDVTNSSLATSGTDYGVFGIYLNGGSAGWKQIVGYNVLPATNGWQRISGSLAGVSGSNYNQVVVGLISQNTHTLTNTVRYWIDNVRLIGPPSVNTNRPALSIAKAPPAGLTCMATAPTDPWQRQMVRTVNTGYSWHTATAASNTTTYAMTVAAFPGAAQSGFEAMMYLIPENGMSNPDGGSVDWDSANVVYFTIGVQPNGIGRGNFRYKVNSAGAENFQTSTNLDCGSGPLGTWALTFNNNTNVTLAAPNGTNLSLNIAEDAAANFQGNLIAYFGVRPTAETRIGQSATFSRIKITGAAAPIDDTFVSSGPPYDLDAATWLRKAASPQGIFVTAPDAKYWVTWPQPDNGYTNVFVTDNLTKRVANGQWHSLPVAATGWLNVAGASRMTVVNQSALSAAFSYTPTNCFFELFHP
jgi:hypothetical protein